MAAKLSLNFTLTTIKPLLSAGQGSDIKFLSTSDIRILHILPFNLGDGSFGITVSVLNKTLLETRTLSNLQIVSNLLGSLSATSLLATA